MILFHQILLYLLINDSNQDLDKKKGYTYNKI